MSGKRARCTVLANNSGLFQREKKKTEGGELVIQFPLTEELIG